MSLSLKDGKISLFLSQFLIVPGHFNDGRSLISHDVKPAAVLDSVIINIPGQQSSSYSVRVLAIR